MPEPTAEQLGREAGEAIANAIADNLEAVLLKMADSIARVQAEQEEQADEIRALSNRIEALTQAASSERPTPTIHVPSPEWNEE